MSDACVSPSLAECAANQIRGEICRRELKPGEVIGTELELAARLQISRITLREAIGRLRGLGLVNSRQRKGLIVAQPDLAETLGLLMPQYVVDHATLTELAELRCWLEIGCVQDAVKRATEADIERLKELSLEYARLIQHDRDTADEIDLEFHKTMLSATGNDLFKDMHRVIRAFFQRGREEFPDWYMEDTHVGEHTAIAEAFAERNVERARELLSVHLHRFLHFQKGVRTTCPRQTGELLDGVRKKGKRERR